MKIKNSTKRLLTALVLLCFMWLFFYLTQISFIQEENKNLKYIPSTSTFAIRIGGKQLVESTFFSVLFEAKDEKVIQKLKELFKNPSAKEKKVKNKGINYLSDIAVFSTPFKTGKIIGISVNLSNPLYFKENLPTVLNDNQFFDVIDNVGIILTYIGDKNEGKIKQGEFNTYFKNNILSLSKKKKIDFIFNNKNIFETYTNGELFGNATSLSSSKIQFELIKSGLILDGELSISPDQINKLRTPPKLLAQKNRGFHFSTAIIPKTLQDSITSFCAKKDLILPELRSFSLNYEGINIVNDETGMHTLPDLDLILEFKTSFSIDNFLKNNSNFGQYQSKLKKNQLIFDNKIYYISQINSNTISIGISEKPKILENKSNEILAIKGDLSSLLKIDGGGMIVSLIEMVPAYRSSKELSQNIEKINISIKKSSPKKAILKGSIKFKKDHFAMNEILKFLLNSQIIS